MNGIKVLGIGLGIYPYKAKEIFNTFLYTNNPEDLLKGISIIFGKNVKKRAVYCSQHNLPYNDDAPPRSFHTRAEASARLRQILILTEDRRVDNTSEAPRGRIGIGRAALITALRARRARAPI